MGELARIAARTERRVVRALTQCGPGSDEHAAAADPLGAVEPWLAAACSRQILGPEAGRPLRRLGVLGHVRRGKVR